MEILHFPVRGLAQLERKISEGAEALGRNTRIDRSVGSTWRYLYQILHGEGSLANYYASLALTPQQIAHGLARGTRVKGPKTLLARWISSRT